MLFQESLYSKDKILTKHNGSASCFFFYTFAFCIILYAFKVVYKIDLVQILKQI